MSDACIMGSKIIRYQQFFIGTGYANGTILSAGFCDAASADTGNVGSEEKERKGMLNRRIDSIAKLKDDWNGYGATPFSSAVVGNARALVSLLPCKAKVFPTAQSSIQFEFDTVPGKYLEVEVFSDHYAMFFDDSTVREELDSATQEYILQRIAEYNAK